MKTGTKSLLFGVHQFAWHPVTVFLAWCHLYGRPTWRETVCIFIHDWGYWGCAAMDDEDGQRHPEFAARLAGRMFGQHYHDLVLLHSRHLAKKLNREPSRLCWADKVSMVYDPFRFYVIRATLSGEIHEYRANAAASGFTPAAAPHRAWFEKLRTHLVGLASEIALARLLWIDEAARLLANAHGHETPNDNLRAYAVALAENYFDDVPESERLTPRAAVEEEISCS